jgi:hypothetical protein
VVASAAKLNVQEKQLDVDRKQAGLASWDGVSYNGKLGDSVAQAMAEGLLKLDDNGQLVKTGDNEETIERLKELGAIAKSGTESFTRLSEEVKENEDGFMNFGRKLSAAEKQTDLLRQSMAAAALGEIDKAAYTEEEIKQMETISTSAWAEKFYDDAYNSVKYYTSSEGKHGRDTSSDEFKALRG